MGSHSPFGFIWQVCSATGWTVDYVLWGVSYPVLILMISDAPHYEKKPQRTDEEEGEDIAGFFQSRLI